MGGGCGAGGAENPAQAVHGVHARQQRPAIAVLHADSLVVHGDVDHAVGGAG
jgi:hypothetical protein